MKNLCFLLSILIFTSLKPKPNDFTVINISIEVFMDTITVLSNPPIISSRLPHRIKSFVKDNYALSCHVSQKYGIPVSIVLGISGLESGWGTSFAAKNRFNFHGLYKGKKEYKNKKDGFEGLGEFLKFKRYKPLNGVTDYKEYCQLLRTTGFTAHDHYPAKLQSLIEYVGLQKLD